MAFSSPSSSGALCWVAAFRTPGAAPHLVRRQCAASRVQGEREDPQPAPPGRLFVQKGESFGLSQCRWAATDGHGSRRSSSCLGGTGHRAAARRGFQEGVSPGPLSEAGSFCSSPPGRHGTQSPPAQQLGHSVPWPPHRGAGSPILLRSGFTQAVALDEKDNGVSRCVSVLQFSSFSGSFND